METITKDYSIPEVLGVLSEPIPAWLANDPDLKIASANSGSGWCATNFEDARRAAERGDVETLGRIDAAARRLNLSDSGMAPRKVNRRSIAGGMVDLGSYLSGAPDCMIERVNAIGARRVIRIGVNATAHCGIGSGTLAANGAAIGSIVRLLTLRGYSVGVDVILATERNARIVQSVRVKAPGEYLDPALLAFWISNPASFRRVGMRLLESLPEKTARRCGVGKGYGYPVDIPADLNRWDVVTRQITDNQGADRFMSHYRDLFASRGIDISGE